MGIGAALGGAITAIGSAFAGAGAAIAGGLGVADATLGGVAAGSLIGSGLEGAAGGALLGGGIDAATGKPILPGILAGGLGGAAVGGLGPAIGGELGIGAIGGDALAGAASGALTSPITGTNPVTGALEGGLGGAATGALSSATAAPAGTGSAPGVSGGPGPSASAIAAPPGVGDLASTPSPFGGAASDASAAATYGGDAGNAFAGTSGAAPSTGGLTSPSVNNASLGVDTSTAPGANFGTPTTAAATQGLDQGYAPNTGVDLPAGTPVPPIPTYGTDASGISTAPPSTGPNPGFGAGVTATPGVNDMAGTSALSGGSGGVLSGTSIGNAISNPSLGTIGKALSSNANWLLPAALIGYEGLQANKGLSTTPGYSNLVGTANQLSTQSGQLESYLTSGTLPPGVANSLSQAGNAAKAAIRGQYASRGMSGSSAEQQDLSNVDQTIVSQGATIATQLLNTGISEANLSSSLYSQIMQASLTQDNQLGSALATLAGAAAKPTINVAGQQAA